MTQKLKKSLRGLSKDKQDKPVLYSGELGVPLNGNKTVEVPNRKGFVFVRLKGNTSELIQAHNAVVSPVYGLPVLVGRQGNIYQVIGHNIDTYQGQANTPYLPKHGPQHSFNHNLGIGGDIVWVYGQQFMPMLSYPSGTNGSMSLALEPSFYEWNGTWRYAQNTGTPDYTPYIPTITGSARMVLSYIDPSDNSIKLVPGTPFDGLVTGSAQIAQYIPDIPRSLGVPLAAVRLTTGTTSIGWDAVYDMRDFYTVGSAFMPTGSPIDTIGFAGLDEGIPLGTGTMLNVTGDLQLSRSGTMFNLSYTAGGPGGGGGAGVMAWDEGVPLATGTVFNFVGSGVTATASGAVIDVSVPTVYPEQVDVSYLFPFTVNGAVRELDTSQIGYFRWHGSPANTDYLEWKVLLQAGTWRIDILAQKNVNKGILTVSIDGSSVGTIDLYAASGSQNVPVSITGISIATTGVKTLKIATPTKNASSSNYNMAFSFITLTKTG